MTASPARKVSGSNYGWYALKGCERDSSYVLRGMAGSREVISSELRAMRRNGQTILRVPFVFEHDHAGGYMSSGAGGLAPRDAGNVESFLQLVRQAGFEKIVVAVFTHGTNSPLRWKEWDESLYRENMAVTRQIRELVRASGLPYILDLANEAVPAPGQTLLMAYARRTWQDYTAACGKDDTLGFSVIPSGGRVGNMRQVYGEAAPDVFDFHFYDDAGAKVLSAYEALRTQGLEDRRWIVGEMFYDSAAELAELDAALLRIGKQVDFLLQWPLRKDGRCRDVDVIPLQVPG